MNQSETYKRLSAKIAGIKRSQRFIDYYESDSFAHKLEMLIGEIEKRIDDGVQGVKMITAFIETDNAVFNRADDSNGSIGDVYRIDACEAFIEFARRCEDKSWLEQIVFRLYSDDNYGIRYDLIDNASEYLPESSLQSLLDQFWSQAYQSSTEYQKRHWLGGIESIARQLNDAPLFQKARLTMWPDLSTAACYDIALVYFESGNSHTALEWLEKVPPDETFKIDERDRLLLRINAKLGNRIQAEETAWRIFRRYRNEETLALLLEVVGQKSRKQIIDREVDTILKESELDYPNLDFLIQLGRLNEAEQYIMERHKQLNGDYYSQLLPWAKTFETHKRYLVSSLIYRALLDSILNRGRSKAYFYGVRYLHKLDNLSSRINDWGGFPNNEDYKLALRIDHKRKLSFWNRYEK